MFSGFFHDVLRMFSGSSQDVLMGLVGLVGLVDLLSLVRLVSGSYESSGFVGSNWLGGSGGPSGSCESYE